MKLFFKLYLISSLSSLILFNSIYMIDILFKREINMNTYINS